MSLVEANDLLERAKASFEAEDWESAVLDTISAIVYAEQAFWRHLADSVADEGEMPYELAETRNRGYAMMKAISGHIDPDKASAPRALEACLKGITRITEAVVLIRAFRNGYNDGRYGLYIPPSEAREAYLAGHGYGCKRRGE